MRFLRRICHFLSPRSRPGDKLRLATSLARLWLANRFARSSITQPGGPVVSLTTFGPRLRTVWLAIESIASGALRPSRLILWLDDQTAVSQLPAALRRLEKRGLEIRTCRNDGPHKKYYPFLLSQDRFELPLVTADDDVLYPRFWLQDLTNAFRHHPRTVSCYRSRVVSFTDAGFARYTEWPLCASTVPSFCNLATGASGILYPPEFLYVMKRAGNQFRQSCPTADDVWLHLHEVRAGYPVRQVFPEALHFPVIPGTRENGLWKSNLAGGNDEQIRAAYTAADIVILRRAWDGSL